MMFAVTDIACSHYFSCVLYGATIDPNSPGVYGSALTAQSTPQCAIVGEYNYK